MSIDNRTAAEIAYDSTRLSPVTEAETEDTSTLITILSDAERYAKLDQAEALVQRVYGPGLSHAELLELAQRVDAAIAADLAAAAELPPDIPLSEDEEVLTRLVLSHYDPWADIFAYADELRSKQRGA